MPATFEVAEDAEAVARGLIEDLEVHGWLKGYAMRFVFRDADSPANKGGRPVWGKVQVISGLAKFLAYGSDAAVVIERRVWERLSGKGRRALMDHLLTRLCSNDDGSLTTVEPDIAEFAEVIARNGLWRDELSKAAPLFVEHSILDQFRPPDVTADGERVSVGRDAS